MTYSYLETDSFISRLQGSPSQPNPGSADFELFAPLAREIELRKNDPLALLEDVANLALKATVSGSSISISDAGEIELLRNPHAFFDKRILPTLCGSSDNLCTIRNSVQNLEPSTINNRKEFLETYTRLRRVSNVFHQAADINPYRLFYLLEPLGLDRIIPTFFAIEFPTQDYIWKMLFEPGSIDAEIANLLGFTAHRKSVNLFENEILFDLVHQVEMNPDLFMGRLSGPNLELFRALLRKVKPGSRRLLEVISEKGNIPEDLEEMKGLLFRLSPDIRDLDSALEDYDIVQKRDEKMIRRCLELAREAYAEGAAEPVACVLENTATGEKIETPNNVQDRAGICEHAEILALKDGVDAWGLQNTPHWILYTSLEPCESCMLYIYQRFPGIKAVAYSAYSETGGQTRGGMDRDLAFQKRIRQADVPTGGLEIRDGVLSQEGTSLYRDVVQWKDMVVPYNPTHRTYWQRKFTELLFPTSGLGIFDKICSLFYQASSPSLC